MECHDSINYYNLTSIQLFLLQPNPFCFPSNRVYIPKDTELLNTTGIFLLHLAIRSILFCSMCVLLGFS